MKNQLWISAARPKTLPAGSAPVILGLSIAYFFTGHINYGTALLTLLCALGLQISSNLINDYYDGVRGLDDGTRLGPKRLTAEGLVTPRQMKHAFIITLSASFILGLYLMFIGGAPIVTIGLTSLFFAWAYTGGPMPLSYIGLGEVFAFIFFGPVAVWGTYYIQTQNFHFPSSVIFAGTALGLLSSALMGVNNLRDTWQDKAKGKTTISTLLGPRIMRKLVFLFIILSLFFTLKMMNGLDLSIMALTAPIILFMLFSKLWPQILYKSQGQQLNDTLANIGKYLFLSSVISSLTLILNRHW